MRKGIDISLDTLVERGLKSSLMIKGRMYDAQRFRSDIEADENDIADVALQMSLVLEVRITREDLLHLFAGDPTMAELREGIITVYHDKIS